MLHSLALFLMTAASFSIFVPALFALQRLRGPDRAQRLLSVRILVSIVFELAGLFIGKLLHMPNLFLTHLFPVIEFMLLALIFEEVFSSRLIRPLIVGYTLVSIANTAFNEGLNQFNTVGRAIGAGALIVLVVAFFYKTLRDLRIRRLEQSPLFWISSGMLIYFSASFIVFIFGNYLLPSQQMSAVFWGIHAIFSAVANLFYAIALWIHPPHNSPSSY